MEIDDLQDRTCKRFTVDGKHKSLISTAVDSQQLTSSFAAGRPVWEVPLQSLRYHSRFGIYRFFRPGVSRVQSILDGAMGGWELSLGPEACVSRFSFRARRFRDKGRKVRGPTQNWAQGAHHAQGTMGMI